MVKRSVFCEMRKGFTIIEVVLVLAIAGLIFLMVFVAVPNMQRSQRDQQRRNTLSAIYAAVPNYLANSRGKMPFNYGNVGAGDDALKRFDTSFITSYVDSTCNYDGYTVGEYGDVTYNFSGCSEMMEDPSGNSYQITVKNGNSGYYIPSTEPESRILIASGNTCEFLGNSYDENGGVIMTPSNSPRSYIAVIVAETGGLLCIDNGS